ncbi:MAG: ribonuclease Z [Bacteroidales bacterium]|nr:ribonuclease Z [Bacteroidales bacterium]
MNEFSVTILGSSSAIPTSTRFPSAQLVSHNYKLFLVDCGEGAQIQLRKNQIRFSKIHHIFISHMHGDHFFGLIGLISTFNLLGRKMGLHIYAPMEIEQVLENQLHVTQTKLNFAIHYHFLDFNTRSLIFENKELEIYSFPLNHSIPTCGFLFKEKAHPRKIKKSVLSKYAIADSKFEGIKQGDDFIDTEGNLIPNDVLTTAGNPRKSFAYCSDTAYSKTLSSYIKGVDLVYHECSFMEDMRKTAEEKMHATTYDAAQVAKEAGAKRLLIGHYSARYKDIKPILLETQSKFANTLIAIEGLKIEV